MGAAIVKFKIFVWFWNLKCIYVLFLDENKKQSQNDYSKRCNQISNSLWLPWASDHRSSHMYKNWSKIFNFWFNCQIRDFISTLSNSAFVMVARIALCYLNYLLKSFYYEKKIHGEFFPLQCSENCFTST